jgi:hypothetical protein
VSGSRELVDRGLRGYMAIGRIPNATLSQAQTELEQAMRELARLYPESNGKMQAEVVALLAGDARSTAHARQRAADAAGHTAAASARGVREHREPAARARQRAPPRDGRPPCARRRSMAHRALLLIENVMMAVAGAAIGAVIAAWASGALRAVPFITAFPIKFQTSLDGLGLTFAMTLGVLCGVIFGIVPALQLAGLNPQAALHSGARTAGKSRLRNVLMGAEVGLALVVLLAAALFLRSFTETQEWIRVSNAKACCWPPTTSPAATSTVRSRATSRAGCSNACARCPTSRWPRSPAQCRSTFTGCRCARLRSKGGPRATPRPTPRSRTR